MNTSYRKRTPIVLGLGLSVALGGCASMNNTERGATAGAATGAVVGGIIGNNNGSTARGAILGAVIGGAAGAVIGSQMDEQADDLAGDLDNATVERVGEGIQITFDSGILFDFDQSALRSTARGNLADLAASLDEYPDTHVLVVGHTDAVGDADYNQDLSTRRAEAARSYLATQGVDRTRVEARGLGETEPVADNETDAGRQQNRRVEVAIFASPEHRAEMERRYNGSR